MGSAVRRDRRWTPGWGSMLRLFLQRSATTFFAPAWRAPTGASVVLIPSIRLTGVRVGDRGGTWGEGPRRGDVLRWLRWLRWLRLLRCQREGLILLDERQ